MLALLSLIMMGAWIWMIVIAFKNDQILWGVLMIIFSVLPAFFYGVVHWDKAKQPFIVAIIAFALMFVLVDPEEFEAARLQQQNTEILP